MILENSVLFALQHTRRSRNHYYYELVFCSYEYIMHIYIGKETMLEGLLNSRELANIC